MVKCSKCGKEVGDQFYYGFFYNGQEYEFEDGVRCNACTFKARGIVKKGKSSEPSVRIKNPIEA